MSFLFPQPAQPTISVLPNASTMGLQPTQSPTGSPQGNRDLTPSFIGSSGVPQQQPNQGGTKLLGG